MPARKVIAEQQAKEKQVAADQTWSDFVQGNQLAVNYKLELVPLNRLFVDYHESVLDGNSSEVPENSQALGYQRLQARLATEMIRDGVKADLFGPLVVNKRRDGTHAVVDGGTRYRVLKDREGKGFAPSNLKVPCLVFQWGDEQEIRNYIDLNWKRAGLSAVDFFVAKVKSGDPESVEIEEILTSETGEGIHVRKNGWQCVSAIKEAHRRKNLRQTMIMLRQLGWLGKPRGRTQVMVFSISKLLKAGIDERRALKVWGNLIPSGILNEAKSYKDIALQSRGVHRVVSLHLANIYNTKLAAKNRIDITQFMSRSQGNDDETELA